jgi:hypothetical protein
MGGCARADLLEPEVEREREICEDGVEGRVVRLNEMWERESSLVQDFGEVIHCEIVMCM